MADIFKDDLELTDGLVEVIRYMLRNGYDVEFTDNGILISND